MPNPVVALKLEDIYRAKAKAQQGTRTDLTSVRNLTNVDTKKKLAKVKVIEAKFANAFYQTTFKK